MSCWFPGGSQNSGVWSLELGAWSLELFAWSLELTGRSWSSNPPHLKTPWGVSDPDPINFDRLHKEGTTPIVKTKKFCSRGECNYPGTSGTLFGYHAGSVSFLGNLDYQSFFERSLFASPLHGLVHASFFLRKALGSLAKKKPNRL